MSGEGAVYKSGERGWGALSIRTNEIHEEGAGHSQARESVSFK